jgi:hypothetical protein
VTVVTFEEPEAGKPAWLGHKTVAPSRLTKPAEQPERVFGKIGLDSLANWMENHMKPSEA